MSHHLTETRNLSYRYPDGTLALKDVSFLIRHGESVGVVGANGAGKSTLLMLLSGILIPTSGEVLIGEVRMTPRTRKELQRRIGMVFQDPDDQLFMPTVGEDVAFGPQSRGLDRSEVAAHVEKALKMVGIESLVGRPPYRLSAGEKRAAALASVLSLEPDILLLDEPSSWLDPRARRRLIELLKGFSHTKVVTSHDLDLIWDLCTRTIILSQGQVLCDGPTRDLLSDSHLLDRAGLELPLGLRGSAVL